MGTQNDEKTITELFGAGLDYLRRLEGITVKELSARAGYTDAHTGKIIKGMSGGSDKAKEALSNALGYTVEEVVVMGRKRFTSKDEPRKRFQEALKNNPELADTLGIDIDHYRELTPEEEAQVFLEDFNDWIKENMRNSDFFPWLKVELTKVRRRWDV